jgi:Na+-driven multidrug efflux pump
MAEWGAAAGVALALVVVAVRPVYLPLFGTDDDVRLLLGAVLLAVAAQQPVAGVVVALDGVLIGAGDGRFLALASVVTAAVFLPTAVAVFVLDGGLGALWWGAMSSFLATRLVLLTMRARSGAWLVPGAALPTRR